MKASEAFKKASLINAKQQEGFANALASRKIAFIGSPSYKIVMEKIDLAVENGQFQIWIQEADSVYVELTKDGFAVIEVFKDLGFTAFFRDTRNGLYISWNLSGRNG